MTRTWRIIEEYSLLLISGAVIALIWANFDPASYRDFIDYELIHDSPIGRTHNSGDGQGVRSLTLHFLVNDILMALFFAIAGKEVWEAVVLKDGPMRGKKALTPLIATAGGVIGPVCVYLIGAFLLGKFAVLANGWAIPTATDIAFSYLVGRLIFGRGHPAVGFLLLLAIADDTVGLVILAIFYPQGDLALEWLLLSLAAGVLTYLLANRLPRRLDRHKQNRPYSTFMRKTVSVWPYVLAGCVSWYGFYRAGIHPALGLLPIIPAMPHSDIDYGIFAAFEEHLTDLLNRMSQLLKRPVEFVLFAFGLTNAGVEFSAIGDATLLVLLGLLIGKPVGIWLFGTIAVNGFQLGLPHGMRNAHLLVVGCVAAIGFTVSMFVASVAFSPGEIQDGAKMGAVLSFCAAGMAIFVARVLRIGPAKSK